MRIHGLNYFGKVILSTLRLRIQDMVISTVCCLVFVLDVLCHFEKPTIYIWTFSIQRLRVSNKQRASSSESWPNFSSKISIKLHLQNLEQIQIQNLQLSMRCTIGLSIALRISKVTKSKGPDLDIETTWICLGHVKKCLKIQGNAVQVY